MPIVRLGAGHSTNRWRTCLAACALALAAQAGVAVSTFVVADQEAGAWVETARGPLCHRVRLREGRVADYTVIAPTEWNFHPASVWAANLIGARAETPKIAENLLRLWALALDPCVPVQVMVTEEV